MRAIGRGRHRRVMSTGAVVVTAALVAIASGGCSSGSSESKSPLVPTTTTRVPTTSAPAPEAMTGPSVIIDTDLSRWWDDVTAIGLANVLQQQGAANVLGIVSDVPNPVAVTAIDAIDTAYGHADIPLGAVAHSNANTAPHGYSDVLARRLPHTVRGSDDVPEAVDLYRQLLARQPDGSVTIVALGAYTNLAGILASPTGRALVTEKVKRLVIMDGLFPGGVGPVTNQKLDLAAARTVVAGSSNAAPWPTPIAWVDGLDGISTKVGGTLCAKVSPDNPMRIAYEYLFNCGPVGDGDWDAPTMLFALGDVPHVFSVLGRGGAAVINKQGGLSWQATSPRRHDFYVHVVDQKTLNQRIERLLTLNTSGGR
jgi:Inosine-uridine preferring nucleoside hydrolase